MMRSYLRFEKFIGANEFFECKRISEMIKTVLHKEESKNSFKELV
jgi:hypothetical protein